MSDWIHPERRRYYRVQLTLDLFGEWLLIQSWGGLDSHRGRLRLTGVPSLADGRRQLAAIARRRRRHGYRMTADAAVSHADTICSARLGSAE